MSFKGLNLNRACRRRFSQQQIHLINQTPQRKQNNSNGNQTIDTKYKKLFNIPLTVKRGQARKSSINFVQSVARQGQKRSTDWSKLQLDKIEFQQRKPTKNKHKHVKSVDVNFFQNRQRPDKIKVKIKQSLKFVDEQTNFQKRLSLKKQSDQIQAYKCELKSTIQQLHQERLKFNLISKIIKTFQIQHKNIKNSIQNLQADNSSENKQIQAVQSEIDNISKEKNLIISKIRADFGQIILIRSQRVVYSSIFKDIQRQIKTKQLIFNRLLINSLQASRDLRVAKDFYQRNKSKSKSYMQQFNYSLMNWTQIKDQNIQTYLSEQSSLLQQKVKQNTALNYYTQSRKVIVLPRYKQHHHQSSRKKIDIENTKNHYEEIIQKVNQVYQAFDLIRDNTYSMHQLKSDNNQKQKHHKSVSENFYILKRKMQTQQKQNIAVRNYLTLFDDKISNYQALILSQRQTKIQKEATRQEQSMKLIIQSKGQSNQKSYEQQILTQIKTLLQIQNSQNILGKIDFVNFQCLINTMQQPMSTQRNTKNSSKSYLLTERSTRNDQSKKDLFQRGQKALDNILNNIKIYENYERAFQRMDFQQEYQAQKLKKKRTLIRRPAMLQQMSKKQSNMQKIKLKKQSSCKAK